MRMDKKHVTNEFSKLKELAKKLHPYDLAQVIEKFDPKLRRKLISSLDNQTLIRLLPELSEEMLYEVVETLSPKRVAELLTKIPPDDMADILGDLGVEKRKKIIGYFTKEKSEEAAKLLKHPEDTAGGLMTTKFLSFNLDTTVDEAIEFIRKKAMEYETIYYIYVVDDEGKLVGVLSLRELVLAPPNTKLKDIMRKDVIKVLVDADQEEVANIIADYNLLAVPVVDRKNKLLGIVTVDDIVDVIEEEAIEDIGHFAGIEEHIDKLIDAPVFSVVKARIPWLLFSLVGDGIIASTILKYFERALATTIALALFIPVIMAMGGGVGNQSSTIFIRGIATGDIKDPLKYLMREVKVGLSMGILVGSGIALVSYILIKAPKLGVIVGCAMFITTTIASIVGILIPKLFHELGVDPAICSVPLISTMQDILGLCIYFTTAGLMLKYMGV